MKGIKFVSAAFLLAFLVTAAFPMKALAAPGGVTDSAVLKLLAKVRAATDKYHDVNVAVADGFVPLVDCVASPDGGMGVHYGKISRLMDSSINALEPEVLLYEPTADGLKLVGVEYFMGISAPGTPVPANPPPAPVLFGQAFDGPMLGHDAGMPPHYDLHVWLWKANPTGTFTMFNPNVKCD